MKSMKTVMAVLMGILFCLLFISEPSFAQIYKWVDEKGTIHLTDDPKTIPEKYRDQVQIKTFKESAPTMPLKRDVTETRQKQAPVGLQQGKESQYGRSFEAFDPTNDPEYQQMIKKLNKSIYYQRDIYQPGTQRVRHRAGDLIPGGPDAARNLKEELDRLVSNPEFGRDTQYRKDVKNFFDSHFYERDEFFPRTQSIMHSKGEIKGISGGQSSPPSPPSAPPPPSGLTGVRGGAIDDQTGDFYKGVKGGVINPRTGEFMRDVGGGYIDPRTGRFIPKQ